MILHIFKKSIPEGLGLDINPTSIKCAHLVFNPNSPPTCRTVLFSCQEKKQTNMMTETHQLIDQLNIHSKKVSLAILDTESLSLVVSLDIKTHDIKTAALLAAAPFIPIHLDTLYFDLQVLEKNNTQQKVLIVFCRRSIISEQKKFIQSTHLAIHSIELKSHAFERSYRYLYNLVKYPDCWSSILIDEEVFIILLWHKECVVESFSDTIIASETIDEVTRQIYQQLMRLIGLDPRNILQGLWVVGSHPLREKVHQELQQSFQIFNHPDAFYEPTRFNRSQASWDPFYIALGLALRQQ